MERCFELDSGDGAPRLLEKCLILAQSAGFQAVLVYRIGSWTKRSIRLPVVRYPMELLCTLSHKFCVACWGIHIDARATIGEGLYIGHSGGVCIGPTTMGRDCNIAHNVTVGVRAGGVPGIPKVGDRVWIGTGSVIFGNVTIGDGATIGPLTVVSRNLPPRIMVTGNPMQVLRKNYDNSAEIYGRRKACRRGPGVGGDGSGGAGDSERS
jgi:serine O-acetyltransferase